MNFGEMEGLSSTDQFKLMRLHLQIQIEKEIAERERIRSGIRGSCKEDRDLDNKVKYIPEFVEGEEENLFQLKKKNQG